MEFYEESEDESIMDPSDNGDEEIVFEAIKEGAEENSDLDPEEFESILDVSAKLSGSFNIKGNIIKEDVAEDSTMFQVPRDRGSTRRSGSKIVVGLQSELDRLSEFASTQHEEKTDMGIMGRTLAEVGLHGYGLIGVSVWLSEFANDKLVPKGWWHNPSMPKSKALERLFDPSKPNYLPQKPVLPGADLAGILWNEATEQDMAGGVRESRKSSIMRRISFAGRQSISEKGTEDLPSSRSSFFVGRRGSSSIGGRRGSTSTGRRGSSFHSFRRRGSTATPMGRRSSVSQLLFSSKTSDEVEPAESLKWRDLKSLIDDPFTAKGPRLELLEKAGFCKAAGVTFQNEICEGIVIYYIGKDLDEDTLNSLPVISYLKVSAEMIGSCASMVRSRRATVGLSIKTRQSMMPQVSPTAKDKKENKNDNSIIPRRVRKLKHKIKGGGMQIPPSPNFLHVSWTMAGTFFALFLLSSLNEYIQYLSEDEFFFVLAPFGALVTLQYALTAAPASQPRNTILGLAVAGGSAMLFTYIPESVLPLWIREVVASTVAIGLMVKCGFAHPPGGALAVLIASGKYNWTMYGFTLVGAVLSMLPAVIVNNLSNKRQYPTYWGFVLPEWPKSAVKSIKKTLIEMKKKPEGKRLSETHSKEFNSSLDNEEV